MADGEMTLTISAALAQRLRERAEAMGLKAEAYALDILGREVVQPGFGESDTSWSAGPAGALNAFGEDAKAYADELDRIGDEALRTGGVPFDVFQARLRNLGQRR